MNTWDRVPWLPDELTVKVYVPAVVGVPDARWGERVEAVVQLRPDASLTFAEADAHCRARLAAYKALRGLHIVDAIARQPSGKPDYRWAKATAMGER